MKKQLLTVAALLAVSLPSFSQSLTLSRQQKFHHDIPPGNYSGICALGNHRYAVVSDKSASDGFFVFHIDVDTVALCIRRVSNEGFRPVNTRRGDLEGIAYEPLAETLFICSEADNEIAEYTLDGHPTGRRLQLPDAYALASHNYGLESLTYDASSSRFYTVTERPLPGDPVLRIQSFDTDMRPREQYLYRLDAPLAKPSRRGLHVHGVSELLALGDGRLLVLEREIRVPRLKLGAWAVTKFYVLHLDDKTPWPRKQLLCRLKTRLGLFNRSFANYEGMCVTHRLADGRQLLLLVADSQDRYRAVLRDWMRVAVLR